MAKDTETLIQESETPLAPAEHDDDSGASGRDMTLPGAEVSVVQDEDLAEETDQRGIMERILNTVLHDDNEHIDQEAGPSL